MKNRNIGLSMVFTIVLLNAFGALAQPVSISLDQAIEKALANNKLYNIRSLQIQEKQAKVEEDRIKAYPAVTISSAYQYNVNIGQLSVPQGALGVIPSASGSIPLPNSEMNVPLGQHQAVNASAMLYQPISQLGKIRTGVELDRTDLEIAKREKLNAALQIRQAVEKLYYGILITAKQQEEAEAKLEVAKMKLYDVESGKLSGKTIETHESGLQANIADEQQNLLKLQIQQEDYLADLGRLTGLGANQLKLENITDTLVVATKPLADYETGAMQSNVDIQLASLQKDKSELVIKATKLSYRPDFGLLAGYTFQKGNILFPQNNPFVGASLKWNIQDIFSNRQVVTQRQIILQQAELVLADKRDEVTNAVDKAYRKIKKAQALVEVAHRAYTYRGQELKVQLDKKVAGLNTEADVLTTRSQLAKSEAEMFAAQLNYRLAVSELQRLTGK